MGKGELSPRTMVLKTVEQTIEVLEGYLNNGAAYDQVNHAYQTAQNSLDCLRLLNYEGVDSLSERVNNLAHSCEEKRRLESG